MISKIRFPIRLKIMITFLCVITVVVSLIIITMANLFNNDKTTYIRDLASVMALHVAEEANSLLQGYHQKLRVFTEVAYNKKLSSDRKREIVASLFRNFDDFVAVSVQEGDAEPVMVYDRKALEGAGLEEKDLTKYLKDNPLSPDRINSVPVYVENATITARLPLLLVATTDVSPNDGTPVVITAMVRLDALLRLVSRPSAFQAFIVDSEGVLIAHSDVDRVVQRASADWIPNLENLVAQNQLLGTSIEYKHEGNEMIGGFAGIKSSGLLAGVQIPKAVAYLTARTLLNNLVLLSLALLIATAVLSVFLAHRLTRPLEKLTHAVRQVGKGHFDIFVESPSKDEIGMLSTSFNQMAGELRGRLEELRGAQAALVQSEKLSAFGQLSAGIAHEVKNPLAGILGHAQLCLRKLSKDDPMHNHLNIIQHETKRCTEIISNLMKFARQEKVEYEPTDLNDVIKHGMAIVDHQLSLNQVKIQLNLANNLPEINGNANQLQQVLMNFAINAQQALDGKPGVVRLTTSKTDDGNVLLVFADNGPGIPENIRDKIFEPFFTTKPAGKGTGLGLSVTYGIIKDHNGEITIESELGIGTAFVMKFPGIVDDIVMASSAA
ncbi:MAG: sensor histidine kinase [Proteobacteria bacterium]|nr:MAG: sensor histidine kinase [Pseudomonadota bacterium]